MISKLIISISITLFCFIGSCFAQPIIPIKDMNGKGEKKLVLLGSYKGISCLKNGDDSSGVAIKSLFPFDNKLYIGYGDGSKSGGKEDAVRILYYDYNKRSFNTPFITSSRATKQFVPFKNKIFVPNHDPIGHFGGLFYSNTEEDFWDSTSFVPGALHVFSAIGFKDNLFVCTSGFNTSMVGATSDFGTTWDTIHVTKFELYDSTFSYGRYYVLDTIRGELFTMGMKHYYGVKSQQRVKSETFIKTFNGKNWKNIFPEKNWFYYPIFLNDSLITITFPIGANERSHKRFAKLVNDSLIEVEDLLPNSWGLKSYFIDKSSKGSERLWAIMETADLRNIIVSTNNLKDWSIHYELPTRTDKSAFSCIAIREGAIVLGTENGEIYYCKNSE